MSSNALYTKNIEMGTSIDHEINIRLLQMYMWKQVFVIVICEYARFLEQFTKE